MQNEEKKCCRGNSYSAGPRPPTQPVTFGQATQPGEKSRLLREHGAADERVAEEARERDRRFAEQARETIRRFEGRIGQGYHEHHRGWCSAPTEQEAEWYDQDYPPIANCLCGCHICAQRNEGGCNFCCSHNNREGVSVCCSSRNRGNARCSINICGNENTEGFNICSSYNNRGCNMCCVHLCSSEHAPNSSGPMQFMTFGCNGW